MAPSDRDQQDLLVWWCGVSVVSTAGQLPKMARRMTRVCGLAFCFDFFAGPELSKDLKDEVK